MKMLCASYGLRVRGGAGRYVGPLGALAVALAQLPARRQCSPLGLLGVLALAFAPVAGAAPPVEALPAPEYSFDQFSPTVEAGLVDAAGILMFDFPNPDFIVPADRLGLGLLGDELDALSGPNPFVYPGDTFALLFSVDRAAVGEAPPDFGLEVLGVPYNPLDQAEKGQAAGDQYMSLEVFSHGGKLGLRGGRPSNATLSRNNYDEGGTSFSADPQTSAQDRAAKAPQDNVDAFGVLPRDVEQAVIHVYFSASAESPSLADLPGGSVPSGATLFYNAAPMDFTPTMLYASYLDLGLIPADDIDGLVVFDDFEGGVYDGNDVVLFSLTPGSPSLATIPGASLDGAAADIFVAVPGQMPVVYAAASSLGLGDMADNIDALDYALCQDALACAELHGIRSVRGDMNCDAVVNLQDIDPFVLALSDRAAYEDNYPYCRWLNGDTNCDGNVNLQDIDLFVACLSAGGCDCPP